MKDGLRFVDCDMHILEPPDLFSKWLDPKFRDRVTTPIDASGEPTRGVWIVDGLPTSADQDLQQHRKPLRRPADPQAGIISPSRQPLSGSRVAEGGRLDFAIARG